MRLFVKLPLDDTSARPIAIGQSDTNCEICTQLMI
jgi:hypothetical protein